MVGMLSLRLSLMWYQSLLMDTWGVPERECPLSQWRLNSQLDRTTCEAYHEQSRKRVEADLLAKNYCDCSKDDFKLVYWMLHDSARKTICGSIYCYYYPEIKTCRQAVNDALTSQQASEIAIAKQCMYELVSKGTSLNCYGMVLNIYGDDVKDTILALLNDLENGCQLRDYFICKEQFTKSIYGAILRQTCHDINWSLYEECINFHLDEELCRDSRQYGWSELVFLQEKTAEHCNVIQRAKDEYDATCGRKNLEG